MICTSHLGSRKWKNEECISITLWTLKNYFLNYHRKPDFLQNIMCIHRVIFSSFDGYRMVSKCKSTYLLYILHAMLSCGTPQWHTLCTLHSSGFGLNISQCQRFHCMCKLNAFVCNNLTKIGENQCEWIYFSNFAGLYRYIHHFSVFY